MSNAIAVTNSAGAIAKAVIMTGAVGGMLTCMALTSDAEARKGGSRYVSKTFVTPGPERGFEGFSSDIYGRYCSYRREPVRRCRVTRSGRERCRIVRWHLVQKCY